MQEDCGGRKQLSCVTRTVSIASLETSVAIPNLDTAEVA